MSGYDDPDIAQMKTRYAIRDAVAAKDAEIDRLRSERDSLVVQSAERLVYIQELHAERGTLAAQLAEACDGLKYYRDSCHVCGGGGILYGVRTEAKCKCWACKEAVRILSSLGEVKKAVDPRDENPFPEMEKIAKDFGL